MKTNFGNPDICIIVGNIEIVSGGLKSRNSFLWLIVISFTSQMEINAEYSGAIYIYLYYMDVLCNQI